MGLCRRLGGKQTNRAFLSCRLPVSGGDPLWSFRQGKTTRMLQTLASFENKEAVKLGWLQSEKMWGENEADGGYGSFFLCSGGLLKAFWKMFHHAPCKHYQLLIATFSWVENLPASLSWFTLLCFGALSNAKKPLMFLLSHFLTTSTAYKTPYAPGIQGSVRGTDWGTQHKALMEEVRAPQDKAGRTWNFHDSDTSCGASISLPLKAVLLSKT